MRGSGENEEANQPGMQRREVILKILLSPDGVYPLAAVREGKGDYNLPDKLASRSNSVGISTRLSFPGKGPHHLAKDGRQPP